jgi:rubrerythrin
MNEFRNIGDLLEIAIRVERCMLDYYKRMRDHIEHDHNKSQFDALAAEEQVHIIMLRRFRDSCADDEEKLNLKRVSEKSHDGLVTHAMRVFNRAEEMTNTVDPLAATGIGSELEIESILFFTALCGLFLGEQHDLIARILSDEKSHLMKLIAMSKGVDSS